MVDPTVRCVSVFGLGKLGSPLAACIASKGIDVIGVDVDARKVDAINSGHTPVYELGLEELIRASGERLRATHDGKAAVHSSDASMLVVATPSEPDGGFSLQYLLPVCEQIGMALREKEGYHLVVVTSTVTPGSTGGPIQDVLEQASGKKAGRDFGLCYGPEFIALGSVIHDFLNPDFLLIGESDERAGSALAELYRRVCAPAPVARMNFVSAELTKLSVNAFITTKISFANMLARICERLPGANVDVVTQALGLDQRIGGKYLMGAISYGGPCFPRDNAAFSAVARSLGARADVAEATDRFNVEQVGWLTSFVEEMIPSGGTVGVLGLSYKPGTDVTEMAAGFLVAKELAARGMKVAAYDPAGRAGTENIGGLLMEETAEACIERSDVLVITTPWPEFAEIPRVVWQASGRELTVIDCWRFLDHLSDVAGVTYLPLGVGTSSA